MTGYRDDREALAQENDALKRELRELQGDNALLRQGVLPPARAKGGRYVPVFVALGVATSMLAGTVVFLASAAPAPTAVRPARALLPASALAEPAPAPMRVMIAADGSLFIDGAPGTDEDLRARASAAAASPLASARIDADRSVPHERAMAVADLLRSAGVARVAFGVAAR